MTNALYPEWKEDLLAGTSGRDLDNNDATDGPYVSLHDAADVSYDASHEFYSSLVAGEVATGRITTPTVANGVFDGDNVIYSAVSGDTCETLLIYRHNSGSNTSWPVVAWIDTGTSGLPVTPNGGDIQIAWSNSGIFLL